MQIKHLIAIAGLGAALALPAAKASAQTIKKAADDVHHTLKTAGNDVKQGAKDVGSATHRTLKSAGNNVKEDAGEVTGVHKVGGTVGDVAQGVSKTAKHAARKAKHKVKKVKHHAHKKARKVGNETKAAVDTTLGHP